ncbi:hypothetical protein EX30DRAFT_339926 [Ascodesmis nigricans]|uniref:F-box domain-containing protein n=1 Tax=Ascodesmis nigricans TaxID=341454 RepID=A0A4S2MZ34_9PEZI|nr:hypothetical protein EX30DRAFT_339926 [Ascodesmis nigricans]
MELVQMILEYLPASGRQETLWAVCGVCRMWYWAGIGRLYRYPKITGKNYAMFLTTICPSAKEDRKANPGSSSRSSSSASHLGSLIRNLDLSAIVHEGSSSQNAKLLHRCQSSVESFTAPQATFSYQCIVALSNCRNLKDLDLSLVSQAIALDELLGKIKKLELLESVAFPRSNVTFYPNQALETTMESGNRVESRSARRRTPGIKPPTTLGHVITKEPIGWPPRLKRALISGSVLLHLLREPSLILPPTLTDLSISHCTFINHIQLSSFLASLAPQLTSLAINFPMGSLPFNALDNILTILPNLRYLSVAVDYISRQFFLPPNVSRGDKTHPPHPLRQLDLESSGHLGTDMKIGPNEIFDAVAEGGLGCLRIVRVSKKLGWTKKEMREDAEDLAELLETVAREAGETGEEGSVGVWELKDWGAWRESNMCT